MAVDVDYTTQPHDAMRGSISQNRRTENFRQKLISLRELSRTPADIWCNFMGIGLAVAERAKLKLVAVHTGITELFRRMSSA
jgi:hypothetical protein